MFEYITGNLLDSDATALVNTVNCEGYMGKGIAYQFKLKFPHNNDAYVEACKSGQLRIGTIHHYEEQGKIIINFPTKDKWRAGSKMSYIDAGLSELVELINTLKIDSIAIPPLGSGHGGLNWNDVKVLIEKKLENVSTYTKVIIYEPSRNYSAKTVAEPKLYTPALILMTLKKHLDNFDALRLQKAAYFTNFFLGEKYFKFDKHQSGPYASGIVQTSKDIKAYQKYHNVKNTDEAYDLLYNKLVSKTVDSTLNRIQPAILKATTFVNALSNDRQLECLSTIVFIVERHPMVTSSEIIRRFGDLYKTESKHFSEIELNDAINYLISADILEATLTGIVLGVA